MYSYGLLILLTLMVLVNKKEYKPMRIEDYIRSNHIIETNDQDVELIRQCLKYLGYINQYKLANLLRKRKLLGNDMLFNGTAM